MNTQDVIVKMNCSQVQDITFGSFTIADNSKFFIDGKLKSCSAALFLWDLKDVYDKQQLEGYDCGSDKLHILLKAKEACSNKVQPTPENANLSSSNAPINTAETDGHDCKLNDTQSSCDDSPADCTTEKQIDHKVTLTFANILKKNLPKQPKEHQTIPENDQSPANEINFPVQNSENGLSALARIFQETLNFNFMPFKPRGLTNKASFCFINSTLQSLLVCSPIHRALRKIGSFPTLQQTIGDCRTPAINGMAAFVNQFDLLERQEYEKTFGKLLKAGKEVRFDNPFEPQCIYEMLAILRPSMAKGERQEDAEEFLGCMLDNLHEEIVSISLEKSSASDQASCENDIDNINSGDGEWQQALSKKKSAISRTIAQNHSLISETFGGEIRSSIKYTNEKQSNTSQPFFTLQLDIHDSEISHIKDAIKKSMGSEQVEHYISGNDGKKIKVEATKKMSFERLPKILILHLKRFIFDHGICQKLTKDVNYDLQLEIDKELLSRECKQRSEMYRSYRLISVVFHHGLRAAGGHYTCDAYHASFKRWIRHDDTMAKTISVKEVMKYAEDRCAYLLFYQRKDLFNADS
ncbi:Ubiquitin carboxyl-terminal hydrolase 10 [Trichoplax sp. H2]|nr:Ubiquitin carboxyl-terminal hydrolase 10 [Trichoplax sp. H2]|eukprot:RDD44122.1 Ubiquitin carboxyl-terminal hydrolase 10 [Trichoplax sp. H2]